MSSSNAEKISVHGTVLRAAGGGQYDVKLSGRQVIGRMVTDDIIDEVFVGYELKARTAGKMSMHSIQIVSGDEVLIELSPYNLEKGLIVYRFRTRGPRPGPHYKKKRN